MKFLSEKINPYVDFVKRISAALENLKQQGVTPTLESNEIKELIVLSSDFSEKVDIMINAKDVVNPASLYDSVLAMQELSNNAIIRLDVKWIPEILEASNQTLSSAGKQLTFEQTASRLSDYYNELSEMKVVSATMSEMCQDLNRNPDRELVALQPFADNLNDMIGKIVEPMKGVMGSICEALRQAFKKLGEILKENVLDKLAEALRKAAEWLDRFKLSMLEKMFKFIAEVAKLGGENGWNIKEIAVEMPEVGLKFEKLGELPLPIPMPDIKQPKVTVRFSP